MHTVWHVADDVVAGLMQIQQKGSLRLRGRTWRLQLRCKDADGFRRWKSVSLGSVAEIPSKAAARRAADRYLDRLDPRELDAGKPMEWGAWCDTYLDRWLPLHMKGTRTTQASIIGKHLRPAFAGKMLHQLKKAEAQDFIVAQLKTGAAPSTIAARFAVYRRMMRRAHAEGLAVVPPTLTEIELPKDPEMHLEVRQKAFTERECRQILDASAVYARDRTAFALGRFAGLRGSEICGLTWSAIDLDTGAIVVRQQALDGVARPLKTKGSAAVLLAPPELLDLLRAYRAVWSPNPDGYLFADPAGRPLTADVLRDALYGYLDNLGIRRRGLHGLRHACALGMADQAVNPETIRRAMRHSSLRITAVYLSVSAEDIAAGLARGAAFHKFGRGAAPTASVDPGNHGCAT